MPGHGRTVGELATSSCFLPSRYAVWNADARRRELKGLCSSVHTKTTRFEAAMPSVTSAWRCPSVSDCARGPAAGR